MLIVGVLVYVVDRGGRAYFVPDWARVDTELTPIFGLMAGWLPTFAHTFAFASLTTAILWPWPSLTAPVCVGWFVIESLFELGQVNAVAYQLSAVLDRGSMPGMISNYFGAGTFDPLDGVAIAFGSAAAYLLARLLRREGTGHA